jgi:hypothetical protein
MLLVRNFASARANQAAGSEIQNVGRVSLLGWVGGTAPAAGGDGGCGLNRMLPRIGGEPVVEAAYPYRAKTAHTAKAQLHCCSLLSSILMLMKRCRLRVQFTRDYHCRRQQNQRNMCEDLLGYSHKQAKQ